MDEWKNKDSGWLEPLVLPPPRLRTSSSDAARSALSVPLLGTISTSFSFVYHVYLPAKTSQIGSTCFIASLVVLLSGSVSAAGRRQRERSDEKTEGISIKAVRRQQQRKTFKKHLWLCGGWVQENDVPSATRRCVDPRVLYIIQTGRIDLLWMSGKAKIESRVKRHVFCSYGFKKFTHTAAGGGCHVAFRCTPLHLDIYITEKRQKTAMAMTQRI